MAVKIPDYSSDVFFYPWVGKKYENGINFTPDGKVIYFDKNKWYYCNGDKGPQEAQKIAADIRPLRLAVLGKEHYCKDRYHCESQIHQQGYYCKALTQLSPYKNNHSKIEKLIQEYYNQRKIFDDKTFLDSLKRCLENKKIWGLSFADDIQYWDKLYIVYKWVNYYKDPQLQATLAQKGVCYLANYTDWGAIEKILVVNSLYRTNIKPNDDITKFSFQEEAEAVSKILNQANMFEQDEQKQSICCMHTNFECPTCHCQHLSVYCSQMPICKYMTRQQLYGYAEEGRTNSTSHSKFRNIIDKNNSKIWNHLLFTNFYQQSMPYTVNNRADAQNRALKAFAEVVKTEVPHIIITWGNAPFDCIIQEQDKLKEYGIFMQNLQGYPPRFCFDKYEMRFTILTWPKQEYPCLLISTEYHPSSTAFPREMSKYIRLIWALYSTLKSWIPLFRQENMPRVEEFEQILEDMKNKSKMPDQTSTALQKIDKNLRQTLKEGTPWDDAILNLLNHQKTNNPNYKKCKPLREASFFSELKKQIGGIVEIKENTWKNEKQFLSNQY